MYSCQECGRKFRTASVAQRAVHNGCPKCGGTDIDLDVDAHRCTRVEHTETQRLIRGMREVPWVEVDAVSEFERLEQLARERFPEPLWDSLHPEGL